MRSHRGYAGDPGLAGRPVVGQEAVDVLGPSWPVDEVEHPADGLDHPLGVARVEVELADEVAVLVCRRKP
jgi:hypothetical protein